MTEQKTTTTIDELLHGSKDNLPKTQAAWEAMLGPICTRYNAMEEESKKAKTKLAEDVSQITALNKDNKKLHAIVQKLAPLEARCKSLENQLAMSKQLNETKDALLQSKEKEIELLSIKSRMDDPEMKSVSGGHDHNQSETHVEDPQTGSDITPEDSDTGNLHQDSVGDVSPMESVLDASTIHEETLGRIPPGTAAAVPSLPEADLGRYLERLPSNYTLDLDSTEFLDPEGSRRLLSARQSLEKFLPLPEKDKLKDWQKRKQNIFSQNNVWGNIRACQGTLLAAHHHLNKLLDLKELQSKMPNLYERIEASMMNVHVAISALYGLIFVIVRLFLIDWITTADSKYMFEMADDMAKRIQDRAQQDPDCGSDPDAMMTYKTIEAVNKDVSARQKLTTLLSNNKDKNTRTFKYFGSSSSRFESYSSDKKRGRSIRSRSLSRSRSRSRSQEREQRPSKRMQHSRPQNRFFRASGNNKSSRGAAGKFTRAGDRRWFVAKRSRTVAAQGHRAITTATSCSSIVFGRSTVDVCAELAQNRSVALGAERTFGRCDLDMEGWYSSTANPADSEKLQSSKLDDRDADRSIKGLVVAESDSSCGLQVEVESVDSMLHAMGIQYIPSPKERTEEDTCGDKLKTPERIHECSTLQDGAAAHCSQSDQTRLLVHQNRYKGCVSPHTSEDVTPPVSEVHVEGGNVRISSVTLRPESLSPHIYEGNEGSSSTPSIEGHSMHILHRRHSDRFGDENSNFNGHIDCIAVSDQSRFLSQLGEVDTRPDTADRIPRNVDRYDHNDVQSARLESSTLSKDGSANNSESAERQTIHSSCARSGTGEAECHVRNVLVAEEIHMGTNAGQEPGGQTCRLVSPCDFISTSSSGPRVVDDIRSEFTHERNDNCDARTDGRIHVRRVEHWMGRPLDVSGPTADCERLLEAGGATSAQQCTRNVGDSVHGSIIRSPIIGRSVDGQDDTSVERQHDGSIVSEEDGRQITGVDVARSPSTRLVLADESDACSTTHCGQLKRRGGQVVTDRDGQDRLETGPRNFPFTQSEVGPVHNRSVCDESEHTPAQVCELVLRSGSDVDRCDATSVDTGKCIRVPTVLVDKHGSEQGSRRGNKNSADRSGVDRTTMVAGPNGLDSGVSTVATGNRNDLRRTHLRSTSACGVANRLSMVGVRLEDLRTMGKEKGLSDDAIAAAEVSWRSSTHKRYDVSWRHWIAFCKRNKLDAKNPNATMLANFLAERRTTGSNGAVLNVDASAVTSFYAVFDIRLLSDGSAASRVKRSTRIQRPSKKTNDIPYWDPRVVLDHIRTWGSDAELSMSKLREKTIFLLRMKLMCRSSDLVGILRHSGIQQIDKAIRVRFYRPKESGVRLFSEWFTIERASNGVSNACTMSCLNEYLARTATLNLKWNNVEGFSETQQDCGLFVTLKPERDGLFHSVSKDTIANMTKRTLQSAGVNTSVFKAHSVRGACASLALAEGMDIDDICKIARWSSENTFKHHYLNEFPGLSKVPNSKDCGPQTSTIDRQRAPRSALDSLPAPLPVRRAHAL